MTFPTQLFRLLAAALFGLLPAAIAAQTAPDDAPPPAIAVYAVDLRSVGDAKLLGFEFCGVEARDRRILRCTGRMMQIARADVTGTTVLEETDAGGRYIQRLAITPGAELQEPAIIDLPFRDPRLRSAVDHGEVFELPDGSITIPIRVVARLAQQQGPLGDNNCQLCGIADTGGDFPEDSPCFGELCGAGAETEDGDFLRYCFCACSCYNGDTQCIGCEAVIVMTPQGNDLLAPVVAKPD